MSHALDKDTVNRILHLHRVQGLSPSTIGQRFGYSTSRIYNIIRRQAASSKLQAALTMDPGACRMNLERRIMEVKQLKRIADAIEEILRLVKKDMEPKKK